MGFFNILLHDDIVCPFNNNNNVDISDNDKGNGGNNDNNGNDDSESSDSDSSDSDSSDDNALNDIGKQAVDDGSTATLLGFNSNVLIPATIAMSVLICGLVIVFGGICYKKCRKQKRKQYIRTIPTQEDDDDDNDDVGNALRNEGNIKLIEINAETDSVDTTA
eukprot:488336_1